MDDDDSNTHVSYVPMKFILRAKSQFKKIILVGNYLLDIVSMFCLMLLHFKKT